MSGDKGPTDGGFSIVIPTGTISEADDFESVLEVRKRHLDSMFEVLEKMRRILGGENCRDRKKHALKFEKMCSSWVTHINVLAMFALANGHPEECEKLLLKARSMCKPYWGKVSTDLRILTSNNFACLLRYAGEVDAALKTLKAALKLAKNTIEISEHVAVSHLNMAALFSAIGRHEASFKHAQMGISAAEKSRISTIKLASMRTRTGVLSRQMKCKLKNLEITICIGHYNAALEAQHLGNLETSKEHSIKAGDVLKRKLCWHLEYAICPALEEAQQLQQQSIEKVPIFDAFDSEPFLWQLESDSNKGELFEAWKLTPRNIKMPIGEQQQIVKAVHEKKKKTASTTRRKRKSKKISKRKVCDDSDQSERLHSVTDVDGKPTPKSSRRPKSAVALRLRHGKLTHAGSNEGRIEDSGAARKRKLKQPKRKSSSQLRANQASSLERLMRPRLKEKEEKQPEQEAHITRKRRRSSNAEIKASEKTGGREILNAQEQSSVPKMKPGITADPRNENNDGKYMARNPRRNSTSATVASDRKQEVVKPKSKKAFFRFPKAALFRTGKSKDDMDVRGNRKTMKPSLVKSCPDAANLEADPDMSELLMKTSLDHKAEQPDEENGMQPMSQESTSSFSVSEADDEMSLSDALVGPALYSSESCSSFSSAAESFISLQ